MRWWLKAFAIWFGILVLAFLNAWLRERVLGPALGADGARLASGVLLSGIILLSAIVAAPWLGPARPGRWWATGAMWLALTLAFEAGGIWQQYGDLSRLFAALRFEGGNLMSIVLLMTLVAPYLGARARRLVPS